MQTTFGKFDVSGFKEVSLDTQEEVVNCKSLNENGEPVEFVVPLYDDSLDSSDQQVEEIIKAAYCDFGKLPYVYRLTTTNNKKGIVANEHPITFHV